MFSNSLFFFFCILGWKRWFGRSQKRTGEKVGNEGVGASRKGRRTFPATGKSCQTGRGLWKGKFDFFFSFLVRPGVQLWESTKEIIPFSCDLAVKKKKKNLDW